LHTWSDDDEAAFTRLLEAQLDKVYGFQKEKVRCPLCCALQPADVHSLQTAELATRIKDTERAVKKLVASDDHDRAREATDVTITPGRQGLEASGDTENQQFDDDAPDAGSDDDDDESPDREDHFQQLEEDVADLVADVHDLALFSKLNFTGFMKILKVCSF
jgi:SPX domain protein involved in polyphosphate accumulation